MVWIVCFDVFIIIRHLKHDRCSSGVIKPFNYSVVSHSFQLAKFPWSSLLQKISHSNTILYDIDSSYAFTNLVIVRIDHYYAVLELSWATMLCTTDASEP